MSDADDRELLIAQAASAFRERDAGGRVLASPAFADLDAGGRLEAFDQARAWRTLEAALDCEGLSTTARAVLGRVRRANARPRGV